MPALPEHALTSASTVGPVIPTFTGGAWQGQFTIPARIFDQLRRRKAAWPIPYTQDDLGRPGWGRTACCCTSRSPTRRTTRTFA